MREILYRAKTKDTGQWVYGYYAKLHHYIDNNEFQIILPINTIICPHSEISDLEEIISETVSQYINFDDENGNKIFEGDIIREYSIYNLNLNRNLIVKIPDTVANLMLGRDCCKYKIIGNVFDNPELLKGGD